MNLKQIEFALAVAEERSFTGAARRCHTVQSALSHQVARLEEELGTPLFARTSRRVCLTSAGEAFVRQAYTALEAVRRIPQAVAAAIGEVRGQLSIGAISAPGSVDIVALIAAFHERHPQVEVHLHQSGSDELLAWLHQDRLDVALVGLWPGARIETLPHLPIARERLVALLPVGHPLAGCRRLTLAQLAALPLVGYPRGSSARLQTDKAFAAADIDYRIRFEVNHLALIVQFVASGMAVGLVPESMADAQPGVVAIGIEDAPVRVLHAVWPKLASPAASAFVALLQAASRGQPDGEQGA